MHTARLDHTIVLAISCNGLASFAPDKLVLHDCAQAPLVSVARMVWVGVLLERPGHSRSLE